MKNLGYKVARVITCNLLLLTLFLTPLTVMATENDRPPTRDEIKTFTEAFFQEALSEHHVPGVAIAFFQEDTITYSAGFGYSDVENQTPVNPRTSVFRAASVAKLLPIIGILQLHDLGKIDLAADVTSYTDEFEVLKNLETPLTAHHLLSHTDGFGTRDLGTFFPDKEAIKPFDEVLRSELKAPVYQVGDYISYGGYGTALAGRLIEIIAEQDYSSYTNEHIFGPLNMTYSTVEQEPNPEHNYAVTYDYDEDSDTYRPMPFLYLQTPPTGGLSTTAIDLAKLVIATTNGGAYMDNNILETNTAQMMLDTQFRSHEGLGGATYGYMESTVNGQRLLIRDGSGVGIRSQVFILPEYDFGFVYLQNTRGDELIDAFNEALMNEYFTPSTVPVGDPNVDYSVYTGTYRPVQTNEHTLVKVEALLVGEIVVEPTVTGIKTIPQMMGDVYGHIEEEEWVLVGDNLFRSTAKEKYIAFEMDEEGIANHLMSGAGYHSAFYKLNIIETSQVQLIWLGACFAIMLIGVLYFIRLRANRTHEFRLAKNRKRLTAAALIPAFLTLSLAGSIYFIFIHRVNEFPSFAFGISPVSYGFLIALMVASAFGLLHIIGVINVWREKCWRVPQRLMYTLTAIAIAATIWWTYYWNLLGLKF